MLQDYAMEIEQYRSAPADQKLTVQDAMRTADPAKAFRNYIAAYCEQYDAVQYGMLLDKLWPGAGKGDEKLASDQQ